MTNIDRLERCPVCNYDLMTERSGVSHKFFFAAVAVAFRTWPADHEFPPKDEEHLRAWLLTHPKVRHCDEVATAPSGLDPADALAPIEFYGALLDRIRDGGGHAFLITEQGLDGPVAFALRIPRSLKGAKKGGLSAIQFYELAEKVFAVICDETGQEVKALRLEAEREVRKLKSMSFVKRGSNGHTH